MTNRHNRLAAEVIPILRDIFAEPRKCDASGLAFSHGERSWSLSPDEARQFHSAVRAIAAAYQRVHHKTCASELQRFCCEHIATHGAQFEPHFESLLLRLNGLSETKNIAYVELSGIRLEMTGCAVGNVRIVSASHPEIDQHRLSIKDINGKHPDPIDPLEALFTRDSSTARASSGYQSPSLPIDEGVAYLLGKDTQSRIRLAERMRDLSRTRNMIVHRGYTAVERMDLLTLANYSWNACLRGLSMRNQFKDENSFRMWCLHKKFETVD
jgi:hypothetical protein